jgi:hypothetical protein
MERALFRKIGEGAHRETLEAMIQMAKYGVAQDCGETPEAMLLVMPTILSAVNAAAGGDPSDDLRQCVMNLTISIVAARRLVLREPMIPRDDCFSAAVEGIARSMRDG